MGIQGEHGTGRNVAPYVEMEWGTHAYELMWRLKSLFDPSNMLNPGVVLNKVIPHPHSNIGPMYAVSLDRPLSHAAQKQVVTLQARSTCCVCSLARLSCDLVITWLS